MKKQFTFLFFFLLFLILQTVSISEGYGEGTYVVHKQNRELVKNLSLTLRKLDYEMQKAETHAGNGSNSFSGGKWYLTRFALSLNLQVLLSIPGVSQLKITPTIRFMWYRRIPQGRILY